MKKNKPIGTITVARGVLNPGSFWAWRCKGTDEYGNDIDWMICEVHNGLNGREYRTRNDDITQVATWDELNTINQLIDGLIADPSKFSNCSV